MASFYLSEPREAGEIALLAAEEGKHVLKVLRMGVGDELCAIDGCGGRFVRDPAFETDPAEAASFDRRFPPRVAHAGLPSQRRFEMLASMKRPRP